MARNPLPHEAHSGETDIFIVRVTRLKNGGPGALMLLPGTETCLTVVSGEASLHAYLSEEYKSGPVRMWVARIGNIPEANFVEVKVASKIEIPK